jgi:hypothetical protein
VSKVLFLDCDGVLLDWGNPFLKWAGSSLTMNDITAYDFSKQMRDIYPTTADFLKGIDTFEKKLAWGDLPPLVTIPHLEVLRNAGYELHVLTQAGSGDEFVQARRVWNLTNRFGAQFNSISFTKRGQSKLDFMQDWEYAHPDSHVYGIVEDKGSTLVEVADSGRYKAIGIRYHHNMYEQSGPSKIRWYSDMAHAAMGLVIASCSKS